MKTNALKVDKENSQENSQFDSTFSGSAFGGTPDESPNGGTGSEFSSGFPGTNASQIFRDSELASGAQTKKLILVGSVSVGIAVCLGAMWWFLMGGEQSADEEPAPTVAQAPAAGAAANTLPKVATSTLPEASDDVEEEEDATEETSAPSVANSSSYTYNEADGGPVVHINDGTRIEVSRSESMSPLYVTGIAHQGAFRIPNPPPGAIYWRETGSSSLNKIDIAQPPALAISFQAPSTLASGESLSWEASGATATFYRVEFSSDSAFENIVNVFSTAKSAASIKDVPPGKYHVRIAGFNKAAGHYDYSSPSIVDVK